VNFLKGSISPTFYLHILLVKIPKAQKIQLFKVKPADFFCAFGICSIKAARKHVGEIDPCMDITKLFLLHLFRLITRCTKEHPYHALPIIMALANSDADQAEIDAG